MLDCQEINGDGRWEGGEDRDARRSLLRDCIADVVRAWGADLTPSDAAVDEHKTQALIAQGYAQQQSACSKRIPPDNGKASDGWREAHAKCGDYLAACQRLCDELRARVEIGVCELAQVDPHDPSTEP